MPVAFQLVIDCADADRMARFWAAALGYSLAPPPTGFATWDDWYRSVGVPEDELGGGEDRIVDPNGDGPPIWFQVVPETKSIKNRLHIDVNAGGGRVVALDQRRERVDARVAALEGLGATRLRTVSGDEEHYAVAMLDPEGNEFDIN